MRPSPTLLALLLLALCAVPALASTPPKAGAPSRAKDAAAKPTSPVGRYGFRSYGSELGLANLAVTSLAQDAEGFLWAGTDDGLFRYDGERFVQLGPEDGVPDGGVSALYVGPDERVWAVVQGGLVVQTGRRFRELGKVPSNPPGEVYRVSARASGRVYVASARGLWVGDPDGGFRRLAGLDDGPVTAVWADPNGHGLWVVQGQRLLSLRPDGRWEALQLPGEERVQAMVRDPRGVLWLRGRRMLLRLMAEDTIEDVSSLVPGGAVMAAQLHLDRQGAVWVPTNAGVARFAPGADRPEIIDAERGLPTQGASAVIVDREGNPWFASEGVHRLQGHQRWEQHGRAEGLPADTVWAVLRTRAGELWAGTNRGLASSQGDDWEALPETEDGPVFALAEDPEGGLWAGGNPANVLLYRPPGARAWTRVPLADALPSDTVNTLELDARGVLHVGLRDGGVLRRAEGKGPPRFERVAIPNGGPAEQINQLHLDGRGRLWVAGLAGLGMLDRKGTWRRYGPEDGLRAEHVECVTSTPDGDVWVSYWDVKGLTRFRVNPDGTGTVEEYNREGEELTRDAIYTLGTAPDGALWVGTARGLKRVGRDGKLQHFGRGQGLPGEDAAGNSFLAEPDGSVWMGLTGGLARLRPGLEAPALRPPVTALTWVRTGNEGGQMPRPGVLELAGSARTFEARFSGLSFSDERRVGHQVRLVGLEDAWRDTEVREVRYPALPPGSYRFEARARVGDGPWGPVAVQRLRVHAPWWRTWWALALWALLALGVLWLLLRWRTRWLRRENARLEALVRARTHELEEASLVDPLTGLRNRRYVGLAMAGETARVVRAHQTYNKGAGPEPRNADLVLLLVDADHFKRVNDEHGHAAGDAALQQLAGVLRRACRGSDTVARWGGEEFLVAAYSAERGQADVIARHVVEAVRAHTFDLGKGVTQRCTVSVGFSALPLDPAAPGALAWEAAVEVADRCLYAAKASGRDGYVGVVGTGGAGAAPLHVRLMGDLEALEAEGLLEVRHSFGAKGVTWRRPEE